MKITLQIIVFIGLKLLELLKSLWILLQAIGVAIFYIGTFLLCGIIPAFILYYIFKSDDVAIIGLFIGFVLYIPIFTCFETGYIRMFPRWIRANWYKAGIIVEKKFKEKEEVKKVI